MGNLRCRVDDRLLHAEVLFGELGARPVDQLVLASHLAWIDAVDTSVVEPPVRVAVVAPAEVAGQLDGTTPLVLLGTIADLDEAVQAGLAPDLVALANRARQTDSVALSPTFWVDAGERRVLARLLDIGLPLMLQRLPTDDPRPLERRFLTSPHNADDTTR